MKDDIASTLRDLTDLLGDFVNLVMRDAYTYKVIVPAESVQVPVLSRE
jgi:hypothetical protein